MSKKTASHVHMLKKHKYKTGVEIFFCTLNCNYKVEAPLALGKECACNICGEAFFIDALSIKLIRPHCINCGKKIVIDADGKKSFVRKEKKVKINISMDDVNNSIRSLDGDSNNSVNQVVDNSEALSLKEKLEKATNPFATKPKAKTEADFETVEEDVL